MIEAAGGVIWRPAGRGSFEVLLIHRPRYDDWSFPKGKLEAGEAPLDAGLREVLEETGFVCEVGPALPEVRYLDRKGRRKRIRYWLMQIASGAFEPNREVDATCWARRRHAATLLTYARDVEILAAVSDHHTPAGDRRTHRGSQLVASA